MTKEREVCGAKVIVLSETYNEYKGTLEEQLEEKDKEIERLNKDLQMAIDICNNRQKEIVRLNNIINELEKWSEEYRFANILKDKLKELKEGK